MKAEGTSSTIRKSKSVNSVNASRQSTPTMADLRRIDIRYNTLQRPPSVPGDTIPNMVGNTPYRWENINNICMAKSPNLECSVDVADICKSKIIIARLI